MYSSTLLGSNPVISASVSTYCLNLMSSLVSLEVRRMLQFGRLCFVMAESIDLLLPTLYSSCPSNKSRTFLLFFPVKICLISVTFAYCLFKQLCWWRIIFSSSWSFFTNFSATWKTKSNCLNASDSSLAHERASCFRAVDFPTPPAPKIETEIFG